MPSSVLLAVLRLLVAVLLVVGWIPAAWADDQRPPPEIPGGSGVRPAVQARSFMVVAAHPLAVNAGVSVIQEGGSAIDAAIAVQMVLGLVEPQSSGIGGGTFMLAYDRAANEVSGIDGRETAPAEIRPDTFLDAAGRPMAFYDAVVGGRSVGVPGTLRLWQVAHQRGGKLPWAKLFQPAIELAERGFEVTPRLAAQIAHDRERLARDPVARSYFLDADGVPLAVGARLKNPAYAETLRKVATGGADAFYNGPVAKDIVAKVRGFTANPGVLSEADLKGYAARVREPTCAPYRLFMVCGFPPPSSGGVTVGQILGLLAHFNLSRMQPMSLDAVHLFAEASKLAYADREAFLADPEFSPVPTSGLTDPLYLMVRAQLINLDRAAPTPVRSGNPSWRDAQDYAPGNAYEYPSTSHFTIVDKGGNIVTATSSIEDGFGSRLMVDGFMLNNQLTDFSFISEVAGRPVANRIEPGKRPRSAMAPTIVLDDGGRPLLALGSPGGARIIDYVAQALVGVLDWGLDIQTAINLPHVINRNGVTELEAGTAIAAFKPALEAMGHTVNIADTTSGLHGVQIGEGHLIGGADPRREGIAVGE